MANGDGRALAIGPSGPPIRPLSEAELAARASAVNFNPNHDELGRFTTGDGVGGGKKDGLDGQGGGAAEQTNSLKGSVGRISDYQYGSASEATCTATAIRTIIAAMTQRGAPTLEAIKAQVKAAVAKIPQHGMVNIRWDGGGIYAADIRDYAAIVQQVLADNGVKTVNNLVAGKPLVKVFTMNQIADFLVASGTPAMLNIGDEKGKIQHSVTVQWDPGAEHGAGRFLVNNLDAHGGSKPFTREQFVAGGFEITTLHTGVTQVHHASIERNFAIIFAEKP